MDMVGAGAALSKRPAVGNTGAGIGLAGRRSPDCPVACLLARVSAEMPVGVPGADAAEPAASRRTIDQVDRSRPMEVWKAEVVDRGRRRHLSYHFDFDTRCHTLEETPNEAWHPELRRQHLENREATVAGLAAEFGADDLDRKVADFVAIGSKPFSLLSHHNAFFGQVRDTFVLGAYYPALVGACALGERILNHLILDLRAAYTGRPEYKRVARKDSFDDWRVPIDTLEAWGVLLPAAVVEFRTLMTLRHRSIHFNAGTYGTLREDALAAIRHLREIIEQQFCAFGARPWFITGTRGLIFIRRDWETDPFVRTYYLPHCPFVGPHVGISFEGGLRIHDRHDYGDGAWTDEEFAAVYEGRTPEEVMGPKQF